MGVFYRFFTSFLLVFYQLRFFTGELATLQTGGKLIEIGRQSQNGLKWFY